MNFKVIHRWLPLPGVLLIASALKAGLLYTGVVPFNADEAVVGLMARHILQGERPIYFYGQAYLGSLDAWLIAGGFAALGESVLTIRLVQVGLYLGAISTTYLLGLKIYASRWIAGAAALFLAIPTTLVTLYTTASLGGYGETLLIGNILFLLALYLGGHDRVRADDASLRSRLDSGVNRHAFSRFRRAKAVTTSVVSQPLGGKAACWLGWALFGFLGGLGFWGFPLLLVYLVPAVIYLFLLRQRSPTHWLVAGLGYAAGAAPWLWFTLTTPRGLAAILEVGGSAISGASSANPVFAAFEHGFNFLLFGLTAIFGLRPPWRGEFVALPLAPFALVIYSALVVFIVRRAARVRDSAQAARRLLASACLFLIAGFILTPFGADPSGRYFLPLAAPLALFMAEMLHVFRRRRTTWRQWFSNSLALGVIAFNWWGTVQSAAAFPPGVTTQFDGVAQVDQRAMRTLTEFLRVQGETRGYSNYWVEFPLAFLSGEELIYAARLPYHLDFRYTSRYNRYPPYSQMVDTSPRAAYITTRHPPLDERIREGLRRLGVAFEEKQMGDFHVFYALSRKVIPEELGLGKDCCPASEP